MNGPIAELEVEVVGAGEILGAMCGRARQRCDQKKKRSEREADVFHSSTSRVPPTMVITGRARRICAGSAVMMSADQIVRSANFPASRVPRSDSRNTA